MTEYRAKPEYWELQEQWSNHKILGVDSSCILELRARVERLEAQANHSPDATKMVPPPVATDEELQKIWNSERGCRPWVSRRAIYDLGVAHGQASSREVAEPTPVAGGLVARVARAIHPDYCADFHLYLHEARAAILEQATWLREQGAFFTSADLLEQEAGR